MYQGLHFFQKLKEWHLAPSLALQLSMLGEQIKLKGWIILSRLISLRIQLLRMSGLQIFRLKVPRGGPHAWSPSWICMCRWKVGGCCWWCHCPWDYTGRRVQSVAEVPGGVNTENSPLDCSWAGQGARKIGRVPWRIYWMQQRREQGRKG